LLSQRFFFLSAIDFARRFDPTAVLVVLVESSLDCSLSRFTFCTTSTGSDARTPRGQSHETTYVVFFRNWGSGGTLFIGSWTQPTLFSPPPSSFPSSSGSLSDLLDLFPFPFQRRRPAPSQVRPNVVCGWFQPLFGKPLGRFFVVPVFSLRQSPPSPDTSFPFFGTYPFFSTLIPS